MKEVRSPGRRIRTQVQAQRGLGAPTPSAITVRAATDLDDWYKANGCTGCDDMGSDLRIRTLAFKAAVLLDPATQNSVSLNTSTPLAQSGFGPGTDAALTLVLGGRRQSTGHCTDDDGNCLQLQTPQIPLELQTIANALGVNIDNIIQQGRQVPQTDQTLKLLIEQIVAAFHQFTQMLKGTLATKEQPPLPPPSPGPLPIPQQQQPAASLPAPKSNIGLVLGVFGIAAVALGTGAVIMTYAQRKKAVRR
jgi:hypothetical protein